MGHLFKPIQPLLIRLSHVNGLLQNSRRKLIFDFKGQCNLHTCSDHHFFPSIRLNSIYELECTLAMKSPEWEYFDRYKESMSSSFIFMNPNLPTLLWSLDIESHKNNMPWSWKIMIISSKTLRESPTLSKWSSPIHN